MEPAPPPSPDWDRITDRAALHGLAPEAVTLLDTLMASPAAATVAARVAESPACADYAEQFVVDVASLTDGQRAALADVLGPAAFDFVQALWVDDFGGRVDRAWAQLFGVGPVPAPADGPRPVELWPTIDAFLKAVARLQALDPVTTELVRLRGARAHDCRLCKSLRSVRAVDSGADEQTFDAVDRYEQSDLDERHKVALRLTDALIWQPAAYPPGLADAVRAWFAPGEAVELVLDVMRNGANKIAVALGADAAHVTEGVEYYDVDDEGELIYGLAR
jgi:alkylhydroperoxidase family enzyme